MRQATALPVWRLVRCSLPPTLDFEAVFNAASFREIVSGRRSGLAASSLRCLLRAAEVPYTAAVRRRNARYDRRRDLQQRVAVPVISVGNMTLGGTGKTPVVEWLARWFCERDVRVALVSRGYKAEAGSPNDEALELAQKLPGVPHIQNRDRVLAAREAIDRHDCQFIILDDGFQHRRIYRDLDIVLIDALEPFGFDHVFPRGTLREPLSGIARSDFVALSRADMLSNKETAAVKRRIEQLAPHSRWLELDHQPLGLLPLTGPRQPVEAIKQKPVVAFCGIGNPAGFRHTLESVDAHVVAFREFPDHYHYTDEDLRGLLSLAERHGGSTALVCTQKDLVKIDPQVIGTRDLWAVQIGIRFRQGLDALEPRLDSLLAQASANAANHRTP